MNRDFKFLNALNAIPNVGAATLTILKRHFGSYEEAWRADESALQASGIHEPALRSIIWKRPSLNPDKEMEKLTKEQIWCITNDDPDFPSALREIPYPPLLLYGKGARITAKKEYSLGVVGTRRPTPYGLEATETMVRELSETGITIVSGLALGIDTRAHETTLTYRGATIAVLGSGLDALSIFPPENRGLARRITENGGSIISEYTPGTPAVKEHFPQRNRIISGLSRGIIVIEARERSGALITARFALEQNRDVFAVPGPLFSTTSAGPHTLIKEGAALVTSARDILESWGIEYNKKQTGSLLLGANEKTLLGALAEPMNVDDLKQKTGLATHQILAAISFLELKGLIIALGNETYQSK